jgi:hypothetical protein
MMAAAQQEAVTDLAVGLFDPAALSLDYQPAAGNHQAYLWAVVVEAAAGAAAVDHYLLDRHHPSLFHLL